MGARLELKTYFFLAYFNYQFSEFDICLMVTHFQNFFFFLAQTPTEIFFFYFEKRYFESTGPILIVTNRPSFSKLFSLVFLLISVFKIWYFFKYSIFFFFLAQTSRIKIFLIFKKLFFRSGGPILIVASSTSVFNLVYFFFSYFWFFRSRYLINGCA